MNKEIIDVIKSAKTANELKTMAKNRGYALSDEEAGSYFNLYHNPGLVDDSSLDDVVGGSHCRRGSTYSDGVTLIDADGVARTDQYLIVTDFNHCNMFYEPKWPDATKPACPTCKHRRGTNPPAQYCVKRTSSNDPLTPIDVAPKK